MNDSPDLSKLSKLELQKLWQKGSSKERSQAARELQRRATVSRNAAKQALIRPNSPAVVALTEPILDPLAAARSGLGPRLRDEVVIRFEGETHTLKLAEWLRSLRSHPVG